MKPFSQVYQRQHQSEQSKHRYKCIVDTFTHYWFAIIDTHSCNKTALAMYKAKRLPLLCGTWPHLPKGAQEFGEFIFKKKKKTHKNRKEKASQKVYLQEPKKLKDTAWNKGSHSAHTRPQKTERKHFVHGRSVSLCYFFPWISNGERRLKRREDKCYWTVWEGKKNTHTHTKRRTRTESYEKEREGIMWVVMSVRHAERGMGDQERENNSELPRETGRGRPSKSCLSAVHSSPTHCKGRRRSQGRTGCLLKRGRGRKERGGREGK